MIELRKRLLPMCLTGALLAAAGGAHAQAVAPGAQQAAPAKTTPAAPAAKPAGTGGGNAGSTPPEEQPNTVILSEKLHYDDVKKTSIFTGNVIMTRGLMTLHSDELQMHEDAQGNQYGTALSDPNKMVTVRQERPENFEVIQGVGKRAEYDGTRSTFDLIGQAVVTRYICGKPFDTIRGQRVRYNEKAGTYEAVGGPESAAAGGRVRSVMEPRARTDAAIAECRKTQSGKEPSGKSPAPRNSTASESSNTHPKASPSTADAPASRPTPGN
jgi:lipopolysaccharide transport protein LptA